MRRNDAGLMGGVGIGCCFSHQMLLGGRGGGCGSGTYCDCDGVVYRGGRCSSCVHIAIK